MKTNYIIFSYVIGITFLIITTLIGCKKEYKFDDGIPAATFAPSIADTAFFGEKLTINFIAKNLSSGTLTLAPINNQDSIVFQEDIKNENSSYIFDTEVLIPEDGSWHGNYLLTLSFSGTKETREIVFSKSQIKDYYVLGGSSSAGWEPSLAIKFNRFTSEKDGKTIEWYDYYGYLTKAGDGLKLIPTNTGWDGDMGMLPDEPGKITSENEENITVPADGFYRLRLDMSDPANRTYKLVSSKWGIIGDATAGQWDNDTDMQLTNAEKGKYEWSITINLTGGKQIKFRENDNWDIALGITEGNNLSYTGENIPVAADGVYLVKLILDPTGYKYSLEKK